MLKTQPPSSRFIDVSDLPRTADLLVSPPSGMVDLDYVAVCIAEQIVRIKISAVRRMRQNEYANDPSPMLTRPLRALAASLGIAKQVENLVAEALPGAA